MASSIPSYTQEKSDVAEKLTQDFLSNAEEYFRTEIKLVSNEYDCLNQMNTHAVDKYHQIEKKLQRMNSTVRTMNETNAGKFSSTFGQLNEIEDAMSNLESTIMKLDAYSRSLESQVKKYEKTVVANRILSPTQNS